MKNHLILNTSPVDFSGDLLVGRLPWEGNEAYRKLRESNRSHVFRFDVGANCIYNVSLNTGVAPMGEVATGRPQEHLFLLGKALQALILGFLDGRFAVLRPAQPLEFWGGKQESRILSRALEGTGKEAIPGLEIFLKYTLDTRIVSFRQDQPGCLSLLLDTSTSNQIDLSVATLVAEGFPVHGKGICIRRLDDGDPEYGLLPHLDWCGYVEAISEQEVVLSGSEISSVALEEALLEPHHRNVEALLEHYFGPDSSNIIGSLKRLRSQYNSAPGKLKTVRKTLETLQRSADLVLHNGFTFQLGPLKERKDPDFPLPIGVERPSLFFGAQGREQHQQPDVGISRFGPYRYPLHDRNEIVIGVICEARHQGRVEQFMEDLKHGIPDHRRSGKRNPFSGGLVGKFRLSSIRFRYETVRNPTSTDYREAIGRLLNEGRVHLAVVQIREQHYQLFGENNPYLVSKTELMRAGVPVQGLLIETIEGKRGSVPYILNNIALASYAKLGGTPWLMAARNPTTHEIVVGMGYTETGHRKRGENRRFVGITSLFSGDGRYLLWGRSREVEFEQYGDALLENLKATVDHVRRQNNWQPGDDVRLIFHVYKHLKHREIAAVKELVGGLTGEAFTVQYAFLDISQRHHYNIFDESQAGIRKRRSLVGEGVPPRGTCLRLGDREALLHLAGPNDLKTANQGLPKPVLLNLHDASDFDDLTYLARQVFHFSYMSWRSFFPATEPVTVYYSRLLARKMAALRGVKDWSPDPIATGPLRESLWFL